MIAGCIPRPPVSDTEAQKYTSSSSEEVIVIGRIIGPSGGRFEAGKWVILEQLREGIYPERILNLEIKAEGWFHALLEPGTYCLTTYVTFAEALLGTRSKQKLRIMAVFVVSDMVEAVYVGTLIRNTHAKWIVKDDKDSAILKLQELYPLYSGQLNTQLSVLKDEK